MQPKVKVEAGKSYDVSMKAWAKGARYFERLEVRYGVSADPAALTETVIAPTDIKTTADAPTTLTGTLRATADGYIYIGVHGISDADKLGLYIDDLSISEGVADAAPDFQRGLLQMVLCRRAVCLSGSANADRFFGGAHVQ